MPVKVVQQSIWPVSVFGLGFLLLVIGLSGVANIQETRRINEQILAAEDSYRRVEKLIEEIQSADTDGIPTHSLQAIASLLGLNPDTI